MDMRWKASWKDITVTTNAGSVISGFSKSKLTDDSIQVFIYSQTMYCPTIIHVT